MALVCPSCGAKAEDGARFCAVCGSGLGTGRPGAEAGARYCTRCGAPLMTGDRFCGRCGAAVRVPVEAGAAARASGAELGDGPTSLEPEAPPGAGVAPEAAGAITDETVAARETGAIPEDTVAPPGEAAGLSGEAGPAPEAEEDVDLLAEWDLGTPGDASAADDVGPLPSVAPAGPDEGQPVTAGTRPDEAPTETIATAPTREPEPSPPAMLPARPPPEPSPQAWASKGPRGGFPLGATLALLGAVAVIISSVLEWRGPFEGTVPRDIPVGLLIDPDAANPSGPNLGIVLLILGTAGSLMALITMAAPVLKFARRLIGLVTFLVPATFALRTLDPLLASGDAARVFELLGIGVYVCAGGAILEIVAGRWFRR